MICVVNRYEAIDRLNKGYPIGFQTDTLPAVGCKPEFLKQIYELKKRDKNKALILMASDLSQLSNYVDPVAREDFLIYAEKFWPGALTLVIPLAKEKNSTLMSKDNTLGVRIPNSLSAIELISETGPLATSSANISGFATSFTAKEVANDLPNLELLGPIPWKKCSGKASTIISWKGKGKWKLIREGQISISKLGL
tara:strand:- start:47 stop:634 length:588 start_codon:yes stop_codon:yes gene_type:complete